MQIDSPSVKPTVEGSRLQPSKISKRRLLSLTATAIVAGVAGMALGSTFRFQAVSAGKAPLFKPQQDFPPLAEWPPQVPLPREHDERSPAWDSATPQSQLVYNDRLSAQDYGSDSYDDGGEFSTDYGDFDDAPTVGEGPLIGIEESFESNDDLPQAMEDAETFDPAPDGFDASSVTQDDALPFKGPDAPFADGSPLSDNRPMSGSNLVDDGSAIIPPVDSAPPSDALSN